MEPVQDWKGRATLVDLLDRIFDKGVIIHLDLIISVAGIPLIGVNLRAALAGMETMLQYGMMQDMDIKTRMWEAQHRKSKEVFLKEGEELILKIFGSYYYSKGIYNAWKSGRFYLTNNRLFLYQQDIAEVVFETPLDKIEAMGVRIERSFTGKDREIIYLSLGDKGIARLSVLETEQFKQKLKSQIEKKGLTLDTQLPIEEIDERANCFLIDGEKVVSSSKMWHLVRDKSILRDTWKPGYLYLTNRRLCWWYNFERRVIFQIPVEGISAAIKERRDLSPVLKDKKVLDIIYSDNGTKRVVSFSGEETGKWEKALNGVIAGEAEAGKGMEKETCPQCGKEYLEETLLKKGCPSCGWRSPRLKKEIPKILKA